MAVPVQSQPAQPPVRAIICADDFALTAGISRSIIELAASGAISATGAMTNRPHWPVWGPRLMEMHQRIDIGLHFNLTCAQPLTRMPVLAPGGNFPALRRVMLLASSSAGAQAEIAAELKAQLDTFEAVAGCAPDFVDGHQHVHAMPGIRQILLATLSARYPARKPYLRDPSDAIGAIAQRGIHVGKAMVIAALSHGFGNAARTQGFATNAGFSGVSDFDPARDFKADLQRFVSVSGPRHLVMVHPGYIDDELASLDPVVATRAIEHAALQAFLDHAVINRVRFSQFL